MIVYHGSYLEIPNPDTIHSRTNLDFGKGFYVTPNKEQAISWAQKYKRQNLPAIINQYVLNEDYLARYRCKSFDSYNPEWLRFVVGNRQGYNEYLKYDIISGGIANDKVFNTIELYQAHLITEDEALGRLKYHRPNHQICIINQEILDSHLNFQNSSEV